MQGDRRQRDTAQLRVIRALKGPLGPGDEVGVYYHLLWLDTEKWVLEKPKFEKGKRYTVFLVNSQGYTLTDQWLAVLLNILTWTRTWLML